MQRLRLGFFLVSLLLLLTACPRPPTGISAPTNVQSTASADGITITWNSVEGADGYRVFRYEGDVEESVTNCNPTTSLSCNDTGVTPGKKYRHSVMAFKGSKESSKSAKTPLVTAPGDADAPRVTLNASDTNLPVGGGTITLTANVTPGAASIVNVEFFRGATSLGTDTTSPYTLSVSVTVTTTFRVVVTDSVGKTSQDALDVTVETGGNTSCDAKDATYTAVVNTPLVRGPRSLSSAKAALLSSTTLVAESCTGVELVGTNSRVVLNSNGTFVYTPSRNSTAPDTFQYRSNGKTATVTIRILDANGVEEGLANIVYVDKSSTATPTGTATNPYNETAQAEANSKDGDTIYLFTGSYVGTIDVKPSQKIIGQGVAFSIAGNTLVAAGSKPRISGSDLGINLGSSPGEKYKNVGTLLIKGLTIENVTRTGPLASCVGGKPVDNVFSGTGIYSNNLQGVINIEDVLIQNVGGHGIYMDHGAHYDPPQHVINLIRVDVKSATQFGIWIDDPTALTISGGSITDVRRPVVNLPCFPNYPVAYAGVGLDPQDEFGGSISISGMTITGTGDVRGLRFIKNNKCRSNVADVENRCTNVTKQDTPVAISGNTITITGGGSAISLDTYYGSESKAGEILVYNDLPGLGSQGDVLLSSSSTNTITGGCIKNIFNIGGGTEAQRAEALARIKGTISGVTCN